MNIQPRIIDQIENWRAEAEAQLAARLKAECQRDALAEALRAVIEPLDETDEWHSAVAKARAALAQLDK